MNISFKHYALLQLVAIVAISFAGCKEDTVIRASASPGIDGINVIQVPDTHTVITKSVYTDTFNSSKVYDDIPVVHALGRVKDPFFGTTWSGIYFQVVPTANGFNFSADPYTIDSAFIILPYVGRIWGDTTVTNSLQSFAAWELTEPLDRSTTYYSKESKAVNPVSISEPYSVNFKTLDAADSTYANGANRNRHLRIKLKSEFIEKIHQQAGTGTFDTKENFLSWLKGIYVAPTDTNVGEMLAYLYLDAASASADYRRAAIEFYFHENATPGTTKTAFFNFQRADCAQFSHISRNYTAEALAILNDNSGISNNIVLLQNEPGATIDIRFPYLKNLPAGIINKAQLVITRVSTGNTAQENFISPFRIDPYKILDDGSASNILDLSASDDFGFVNGNATSVDLGGGIKVVQYKINLPREVQKTIVEKQNELHLRIKGSIGLPAAYSLVAGGRSHAMYKMQLDIVYSTPQ